MKKRHLLAIAAFGTLGIAATTVNSGKYFEIAKNLELFTNIYKEINTYYVDDLDPAKTMRVGVDAMLESLDPFTNYISEAEIEGYRFMTEGKYSGIGASVKEINGYPTITETYESCPAYKAGLRAGDVILKIDGQNAKGKDSDAVYDILKGAPGTDVEIIVRRLGNNKEMTVKLVREEVEVGNVPYSGMVSDEVGYAILTTFTKDAGPNVAKAFRELKEKNPNMKGFILDLRGNGGGLLNEAVDLVNTFIPRGEIVVTTKSKVPEWDRTYKTSGSSLDEKMPIAIIIDPHSASASEIVSGTMQDLDRAVLIGQRSYGKGLVQNVRDIGYNSKVKVTTARYYVPSGRCIQGVTYKGGKPVNIPDSLRTAFKTRNGRRVLDGGGITPDIYLDPETKSAIVKSLQEKYILFDYVNQYCSSHATIAPAMEYKFDDFDGFVKFVEAKGFEGETETDKIIKELKDKAKKENYATGIDTQLKALQTQLNAEKKKDLLAHKEEITHLIEKELASRYYFEKGRVQMGLRHDIEIKEALSILKDTPRYNSLLGKK
jgi:carboxyl-terminal processing protease